MGNEIKIPISPEAQANFQKVISRFQSEDAAASDAKSKILPGPTLEAFHPDSDGSVTAGGLKIRRCKFWDMVILESLNSPLYRQLREGVKPEAERENISLSFTDQACLVYQFSIPHKEARDLMFTGADAFKKKALDAVGEMIPVEVIEAVQAAQLQVLAGFNSAIAYESKSDEDKKNGEQTFFPEARPGAPMASDGGLNASAA